MCLTAPGRVTSVNGEWAIVDLDGAPRRASLALVPDATTGDWVLVTAGLVLEVLDDEAVRDLRRLLATPDSTLGGMSA
jgi:hydrogenase expression/formation protein HypC